MIAIIDYDAGNISSVKKAFEYLGEETLLTSDPAEIFRADHVILPGVGAFGDAMDRIRSYGLEDTIKEVVKKEVPFMGICLGLQLLFDRSDESKQATGLGILRGEIKQIPTRDENQNTYKIPQIGWNGLLFRNKSRLFKYIKEGDHVYFVHSYHATGCEDWTTAVTEYGGLLTASVERDNVFGTQFHPEKSATVGLSILKAFVEIF